MSKKIKKDETQQKYFINPTFRDMHTDSGYTLVFNKKCDRYDLRDTYNKIVYSSTNYVACQKTAKSDYNVNIFEWKIS